MAELTSPQGTKVQVEGDLVDRLRSLGWVEDKPKPTQGPTRKRRTSKKAESNTETE